MQQKRGLRANLPTTALEGELLIPTDTSELYVGTGTGVRQLGRVDQILFQDTQVGGYTIYADAVRPIADSSGRDGWYFKNDGVTGTEHIDTYPGLTPTQKAAAKKKINWWFYSGTITPAKMSEIKTAYAIFTADATDKPYITVYTQQGKTHLYQASADLVAGKTYVYWIGTDAPDANLYPGAERVQLVKTNTAAPIVDTEDIALIGYQTNSGAAVNTVQLLTYMLGFVTKKASAHFVLKTNTKATAGSTGSTYTHTQSTAADTWNITHNLNRRPSVTTVDESGNEIDGYVVWNSDIQVTIYFNPATKGFAYLN